MAVLYMSVKELAERWGCNLSSIYRQVKSGRLPALHVGNTIRIPIVAVEEFERSNTTGL
ncbi:excisionase family DNA-binding protein [Rhodococcus sp. DSM 6344]|nr:excisionase family DNA-binding protein [Rhodococcus erythropolis]